jgi:hypothetical protein
MPTTSNLDHEMTGVAAGILVRRAGIEIRLDVAERLH